MNKLIPYLFFLSLLSCAGADVHQIVVLKDGTKGFVINCFEDRDNCERKAEKLCNNNYKIHEFMYKQAVKAQTSMKPANSLIDDIGDEDIISRFEMTVSCQVKVN